MKTKLPLISLILLCGVLLGAAFGPQRIRWNWNGGTPVDWWGVNGSVVQLGLRDDGIVVWRERLPTTNSVVTMTTNSPAEQPHYVTNVIMLEAMTNWAKPGGILFTNGQWKWDYQDLSK